jgi:hypothetical protein
MQSDGIVVHCDVPDVEMGLRLTTPGEAIKISPRNSSCWEPHVICETCSAPSDGLAVGWLIVAVVSGLICFLQFRVILREKNKSSVTAI